MKDPLLPPPNSKKRNLGERKPGSLPIFAFSKLGETEGVKTSLGMISAKKKRFILKFQGIRKILTMPTALACIHTENALHLIRHQTLARYTAQRCNATATVSVASCFFGETRFYDTPPSGAAAFRRRPAEREKMECCVCVAAADGVGE